MPTEFSSISVADTLGLVWHSLGVFRYLFAVALLAILTFLARAWRQLASTVCPIRFRQPVAPEDSTDLSRLVNQGMSDEAVGQHFFPTTGRTNRNLFWRYLTELGRHGAGNLPPSLLQATDALYQLARIRELSMTARFLAALLPAIGLLGTLIGMFNAFFRTDFTKGTELATTMQQLMQNFALALFTTIAAVILKIGVDLFNHFTVAVHIDRLRGDLLRLRGLVYDLVQEPRPRAAPAPLAREHPEAAVAMAGAEAIS